MGVDLRSIQRKFHMLMGEVKPQIRPRFVVWLDERLAEFKVKGCMELSETLEDPQWIKDYITSKRESKAAAIKQRQDRSAASTTSSNVQPKLEQKSESSNGNAHPDELSEISKEDKTELTVQSQIQEKETKDETREKNLADSGLELVEVKQERVEEDDDDDMIIVGESIAPPVRQFNPMRQLYAGFGARTVGPFQRKRQKFGAMPHRPFKTSRYKPNFRPPSTVTSQPPMTSFPSHSATSQSFYTPTPSSFQTDTPSFVEPYTGDSSQLYATEHYSESETLRIPPHLQSQATALQLQEQSDYDVTDEQIYANAYEEDYGDESYDSSYMEGESSLVYDEDGNAVIKGENQGDDSSMEPVAGTSAGTSQDLLRKMAQLRGFGSQLICNHCARVFRDRYNLREHIICVHHKIRAFSCQHCGRKFGRKGDMVRHVRTTWKCRKRHSPNTM